MEGQGDMHMHGNSEWGAVHSGAGGQSVNLGGGLCIRDQGQVSSCLGLQTTAPTLTAPTLTRATAPGSSSSGSRRGPEVGELCAGICAPAAGGAESDAALECSCWPWYCWYCCCWFCCWCRGPAADPDVGSAGRHQGR